MESVGLMATKELPEEERRKEKASEVKGSDTCNSTADKITKR